MKSVFQLTIALPFLFATAVHAGFLDEVNKAMDAAKKASAAVSSSPAGTPSQQPNSPANVVADNGNTLLLPFDLSPYARSKQHRRIDNPMERLQIPISAPQKTPEGFVATYNVPVEGKVTMLQFSHRSDDSPLLIKQHYEAWLAQAGFERLLVCEAPCEQASGNYQWGRAVDPTARLDSNYLPSQPTYVAGYRADAMALVGIGTHGDYFSSFVKVVEGRVLDAHPWKTLTTPRTSPPPVAPSRPVPQATAPAPAPAPAKSSTPASTDPSNSVEMIASVDLQSRLAESKGFVVVQMSSFDPNCPFCVRANPKFDEIASRNYGKATFWRVMWQPWGSLWQDTVPNTFGVKGLPTTFTFKNGQLVRRAMGDMSIEEFEKLLIRGLK